MSNDETMILLTTESGTGWTRPSIPRAARRKVMVEMQKGSVSGGAALVERLVWRQGWRSVPTMAQRKARMKVRIDGA